MYTVHQINVDRHGGICDWERIKTLLLTHVEICLWLHCGRAEKQAGHNGYKIKQKTCGQQAELPGILVIHVHIYNLT